MIKVYLFKNDDIRNENPYLVDWQYNAYQCFSEKITNKQLKFPCIPATQGFTLGHFKYGFIGNPIDEFAPTELAKLLKEYALCYQELGNYTSLVIFFEQIKEDTNTVYNYENLFWKILNEVSQLDQLEWPSDIPDDPSDRLWEYCFHGERFFIYSATPKHEKRLSRSFPYFMLAITPRKVFEEFQQSNSAKQIKNKIRERLIQYDNVPPHPELKQYGEKDNYESKQYFLRDDQSTLTQCPFHKS
ncbi:YqcI/YcgG family protein [Aquibacillus saliphilus]|uniref:YqcI/YcgG family protein n=1 Tax=Aquibacillus saliphilus TaxID=1909422 RepID=UPI001CF01CE8|nr:YqcI/YcgG family protein [Aquibacillus saliphilus]